MRNGQHFMGPWGAPLGVPAGVPAGVPQDVPSGVPPMNGALFCSRDISRTPQVALQGKAGSCSGRWKQKGCGFGVYSNRGSLVRALDASTRGRSMRSRRSLSKARKAEAPSLDEHGPAQDSVDTALATSSSSGHQAAEDQDGVQKHAGRASGCLRCELAAFKNSRRWKSEDQRDLKDEGHCGSLPKKSRGVLYAAHASHGPLASSSIEPDSQNLRSVAIESSQSTSKNTLRGRAPQDVQGATFAAPRETASGF
ncbi:hypothetical protein C8R47DRAFT_1079085 [Mycena vitilis]|nr:hypothetical protein C8R47DRAFT_1079076 [Mycena vitilis]KAJ6466003.1 hypothetical protein C8R47DRAFT_1079085 [Mycena vitilis]